MATFLLEENNKANNSRTNASPAAGCWTQRVPDFSAHQRNDSAVPGNRWATGAGAV